MCVVASFKCRYFRILLQQYRNCPLGLDLRVIPDHERKTEKAQLTDLVSKLTVFQCAPLHMVDRTTRFAVRQRYQRNRGNFIV